MILTLVYVIFTLASTSVAQFLLVRNFSPSNNGYVESNCAPIIRCNANAKYRSANGSCNNLRTPWLGAYKTPHLRIVNAYYNDGHYEFRKQIDGSPLPNARSVQLKLFLGQQFPYWNNQNVLFVIWGQFIAHDTTLLPPDVSAGSDCCEIQNVKPLPSQCETVIKVPDDDPAYLKRGQTCINFIRVQTSRDSCPLTPTTFATHFIDGSQIYGSDEDQAADLRLFYNGRLKSDSDGTGREYCPQTNRTSWKCDLSKFSKSCYLAGDTRVNQNLGIALMQNLFLRFHNKVANVLHRLNALWNDETLYQETRRIVIAVIQHVTYTYYLPILLGEQFTFLNSFYERAVYDDTVNPSTSQEFSTAAFRTLHNEIPAVLNFMDENNLNFYRVLLTDWMDKPDLLESSNYFDGLLRGFQNTPTRAEQPSYNPLISNFLFRQTETFKSVDLLSIDIQRGRDTGLPPYNVIRSVCGIPVANSFGDLNDLISFENVQKLKELYSSVHDIDFIVGALLETPTKGAKIGPTSKCIIADGFYRYKIGDRFFYDNYGQPGSFTAGQLNVLKQLQLSHVICASSGVQYVSENVFTPLNENSRQLNCDLFRLNLDAWKEN